MSKGIFALVLLGLVTAVGACSRQPAEEPMAAEPIQPEPTYNKY